MNKNVYIISGHSNDGKTNWIKKSIEFLKKNNFSVGGVYAPGLWDDNEKIAIDSVLLPTEELLHLAIRKPDFSEGYSRKWKFNDSVVEQINDHLGNLVNCDYVIIDEIGPLEIVKNKGFTNGLKILKEGYFKNVIVAVRPSLIEKLKSFINKDYKVQVIEVVDNPDSDVLVK